MGEHVTRPPAALPELAAALHALADKVEDLDVAQVLGALAAHEHAPGILRDTIRCPACAATVEDRDREARQT
jgi:hypothetical protein